jgi:hypothetical protein
VEMMDCWVLSGRTGGRFDSHRFSMVATTFTSWRSSCSKRSMSCSISPLLLVLAAIWCSCEVGGEIGKRTSIEASHVMLDLQLAARYAV